MNKPLTLLAVPFLAALVAATPTPAPVQGGSLTVAINTETTMMDPTQSTEQEIARINYENVLEGLVGLAVNGKIVPVLATALPTISSDGLSYTFKLHSGVKFHDGSAFTSADVKSYFDWARAKTTTHTHPAYYQNIVEVATPDPTTVTFKLAKIDAEFLFNLARPDSVITLTSSQAAIDANKTRPIGTGPFKFDAWNRGSNVRLVKNPDYYQKGLPYLDAVTFRFMGSDDAAKLAALKAGDIDVIGYNVPPEQANALKADPNFKVYSGNSTAEITIGLNNARKPFNDIRVRRAFEYAIDKNEIVKGAFFGFGTPIGSMNSPGERYYVDLSKVYPYNPEKAKQLLAQAGYPNGLSVKFTVTNEFPTEKRTAEVYAAQLAKIGVNAQIEMIPFANWIKTVFIGHDYDMTIIGHSEPFDMDVYANPGYYFGYNNKAYQALNAQALSTVDETRRRQIYTKMQLQLAQDAVSVWAFSAPYIAATRANVYGWWNNQPTPSMNVVRVFKTK